MIIAVGGGKGGTGKSSVAVNLSGLLSKRGKKVLLLDVDVESPVDHILLGINNDRKIIKRIYSFEPILVEEACTMCGLCIQKCPEHAIIGEPGRLPIIIKELCSGCSMCYHACPVNAIEEGKREIGKIYSGTKYNIDLIQGEVNPGIKQHINVTISTVNFAKEKFGEYDIVVMDLSPGTGANVWYPITHADKVVAVTEPTALGINDLRKFIKLVKDKEMLIVLNKADISLKMRDKVREIAKENLLQLIEIPYDKSLIKSYVEKEPIVFSNENSSFSKAIEEILNVLNVNTNKLH